MGHLTDLLVVAAYLALITVAGLKASGRPTSAAAFFLGERDLPWWAVCLSLLATETSTLTLISVPGAAYGRAWGFVGLAAGYLIGRVVVAWMLLPIYVENGLVSAYQYLGARFGAPMRALASLTFIVTRLLAEGVRLFAASLPLTFLLKAAGLSLDPPVIIAGLTIVTGVYSVAGGVRAIVWTDALQLCVYVLGAAACAGLLMGLIAPAGLVGAARAGKFALFDLKTAPVSSPFSPLSAILGGAVFAMASHGADQLIVQRVLACRSLRDAQTAMIGSGVLVSLLFSLLSLVGTLLWIRHGGAAPHALGLRGTDDVFPSFIARDLPPGLCGLLVAGVLAAAMGSLSSALNALSNAVMTDLRPLASGLLDVFGELNLSRLLAAGFSIALVVCALTFMNARGEAVVMALGVAGFAYGALLGAFCLGLAAPEADGTDAVVAFAAANILLALVIWRFNLAFTWYAPLGVTTSVATGRLSAWTRRRLGRSRRLRA